MATTSAPGSSSGSAPASSPPAGLIAADAPPVAGHLGSYCWNAACSDEFELPDRSALPDLYVASAGTPLKFTLSAGVAFVEWTASYTAAKFANVVPLGSGGAAYDPDSNASEPPALFQAQFPAPPSGDWALVVSVHFGLSSVPAGGDAIYAWHIRVP
jgi:hypothetical protein